MPSFIRFEREGRSSYGLLEDNVIWPLRGGLFDTPERIGESFPLAGAKLLPPCQPSKILAVGLNYRSHLGGRPVPKSPEIFLKPPSSLIPHGGEILLPHDSTDVHFEGELVIVIGKRVKSVEAADAADAIFGVSAGNDVSERNWQRGERKDLQWWRAKGCDTFAPLGPAIVTGLDYGNLALKTRVNGEIAQDGSTSDLIYDCPSVVSWISQWITLEPGDLIYTGTPGTTHALKSGDLVEVELEGVGTLSNRVR